MSGFTAGSHSEKKVVMGTAEMVLKMFRMIASLSLHPESGSQAEQNFETTFLVLESLSTLVDFSYRIAFTVIDWNSRSTLENTINIFEIVKVVADQVLEVVSFYVNDGLRRGKEPALEGETKIAYFSYKYFVILLDFSIR